MQVTMNAQLSTNWDPSMANQGLWQQAMSSCHHHHCHGQDGSSNGQQGLSSQIQQLEQEIQSLENQISALQGSHSNSASSSNASNSSSTFGDIASVAMTAIGMFL
jgi:septal ring factor EnvC (AmiA/AmiB activator)